MRASLDLALSLNKILIFQAPNGQRSVMPITYAADRDVTIGYDYLGDHFMRHL
jgi:hypothetical protein